ncbi:MAG TPA: hypothetical protein VN282_11865 [Pyrinomonadaceae bacterium]|nr:hypothetical protein [Pyrinomonadaceae bacterium]
MKVSTRTVLRAIPSLTAAVLLALTPGCAGSTRPEAEGTARSARRPSPGPAPSPASAATPAPAQTPPAPELSEASPADLRECVGRVYRDVVNVAEDRPGNYVTGDFNGDGSQDIAVVVRPGGGKLEEVNDDLANWVLVDAREDPLRDFKKAALKPGERPQRARVAQGDLLLAVIHGYEAGGWRDPAARQTYLIKNAVGGGLKKKTRAEALAALRPGRRPPRLTGDVISETPAREQGFLYWGGAKYVWHY